MTEDRERAGAIKGDGGRKARRKDEWKEKGRKEEWLKRRKERGGGRKEERKIKSEKK